MSNPEYEARKVLSEARKEAHAMLDEARAAADAVLAEAEALAKSLKASAKSLTAQADQLLHDVRQTHRELLAELRVPGLADRDQPARRPTAKDVFEKPDWVSD